MITYTAITGWRDSLKDQPETTGQYIAFTDIPVKSETWETRPIPRDFCDPTRNAKLPKVLAHQYLDTDYSLWIDGSIELKRSPEDILELLGDNDICFMGHPESNIYNEADLVIHQAKDTKARVEEHMDKYRKIDGSQYWEMVCASAILRRHTPEVERFNEIWWSEICTGSRRDQLSLPYALRKSGIKWGILPITHGVPNDYLVNTRHL
jgi:hypothetical protein